MIKRREFIAGLGSAAAWPVVARAQQAVMPVVGFLFSQSAVDYNEFTVPFLQGLKDTGYVEGRDVAFEYRWAENQYDRMPALAADLVRRRVAVLVAGSLPAALAAKAATTTIPIVFATAGDPVALGLVASLMREPYRQRRFHWRAVAKTIAIASRVDAQYYRVRRSRGPGLCDYPIPKCSHAGSRT
jgi:putative ABC transport system substrate-binding protein